MEATFTSKKLSMARPKKVKQTEDLPKEVENQEAKSQIAVDAMNNDLAPSHSSQIAVDYASNEFDTEILNEAVQEKAPEAEKVVKRDLSDKVPTAEQKQAVHRVLEKKVVNVVPAVRDQIQVTFKGSPRTYSSETLKVMLRSFPNDIKINGEPVTLDANGRCCG